MTENGDFAAYVRDSYAAGILRLDQMQAEATEAMDQVQFGTVLHKTLEHHQADEELEQSAKPARCSDRRFHDDHLWTHPDGELRQCLGVHDLPTMPIAATKKDADHVPGFPSARIYVMDESKIYEHDGTEWKPVDGS